VGVIYEFAGRPQVVVFSVVVVLVRRAFVLHTLIERMLSFSFPLAFIFFLPFILIVEAGHDLSNDNVPAESSHTNNWAVLVCASRYWFNYRVRIVGPLPASCT